MNMDTNIELYWAKRPHLQPAGGTFFVTTRLHGSLPQITKVRLAENHELAKRQLLNRPDSTADDMDRLNRAAFAAHEAVLDKSDFGPQWLRLGHIAAVITETLHHFAGTRYELIAYCLMSNHIHLVITLDMDESGISTFSLQQIMHSIKGFTARRCNELLDRKGPFWEHESYDRLARDKGELYRIIRYVLLNPVKAGLCQTWQEWEWTYINPAYNEFE